MKLKTTELKELVVKASKGVGDNKLIPITSLMGIDATGNQLLLTTTDGVNYLYVSGQLSEEVDLFNVTVDADKFVKLISKLTCEYVSLELTEDYLEVVGNGNYQLELPLDENGKVVKYPNPIEKFFEDKSDEVKKTIPFSIIQDMIIKVRPALATTLEVPCYTNYYVGDAVIGTDTYKIASLNKEVLDTPCLISSSMVDILSVIDSEEVDIVIKDNKIVFKTNNVIVYGVMPSGVEDYQISAIKGLLDSDFESYCKISKQELLQVLDRLSLFVGVYDKNSITLSFDTDKLQILSKNANGIETLKYLDGDGIIFSCNIDIEMLQTQVKAQTSEVVELWYGKDNAIKMYDGDLVQIVALLEELK